ncbi:MAG TPA: response regulator transcription factor [Burkholderiales bacterium]|nr:response regulator transcription factor [Burkholderiales bacterium]
MRILLIEDDTDIAANLYDYLESKGHDVDAAADGITGLHLAVTHDFDAVVLDLALPGLGGLQVCRKLREEAKRDTPLLMLTARDTLEDKLEGFAAGADDYLVKPFALSEVEARLQALNKRHRGRVTSRPLQAGGVVFDPATFTVERDGHPIKLPPKCLRLLELLMQQPQKVFSRAELESAVWGGEHPSSDTLRSHMHILRRALALPGKPDVIETVHGIGYRFVANRGH